MNRKHFLGMVWVFLILIVLQWGVTVNVSLGESSKPPFEWTELTDSPGASLTIEEERRMSMGNRTAVSFLLTCTGFSPNAPVVLWRRVGHEYNQLPATIDDSGHVLVIGAGSVMIAGFHLGEALDLVLMTEDDSVKARAKTIPFPINAGKTNSCNASIELWEPSGLLFLFNGKGFIPFQEVSMKMKFKKSEIVQTLTADKNGNIEFPVLYEEKDKGKASITLESDDCKVKLKYKVGKDALKVQ